jgi:acetyltransferase-like isoleucine patch superfamily enzyme
MISDEVPHHSDGHRVKPRRVVIFGTNDDGEGLYARLRPLSWLGFIDVVAFCDNDSRRHGSSIDGVPIISPAALGDGLFDEIIIAPIFGVEIERQLHSMGVAPEKIRSVHNEPYFAKESRVLRGTTIGRYSYVKPSTLLSSVTIGAFCHIGGNSIIGQSGHDVRRVTSYPLGYHFANTTSDPSKDESATASQLDAVTIIGNDVYIGEGVVVFAGVKIGDGAVLGSRCVVTKDVPPYAIVAGVPAVVKSYRFDADIVESMLEIRWWAWSDETIQERLALFDLPPSEFVTAIGKASNRSGEPQPSEAAR